MDNEKLVEVFKQLGFPEYEAKCYQALFHRESLAVGEIAKLGGIPRTSAYDAMEQLCEKGFAVAIPGRLKRYKAANPEALKEKAFLPAIESTEAELEDLESKRKQKLNLKKNLQNNMDVVVNKLNSLYQYGRDNRDPLDYIEVLKTPDQIHLKFLELYSRTQEEVLSLVKAPYVCVTKERILEQQRVQDEAAERGVIRKGIIELPSGEDAIEYARNAYKKRSYNSGIVRFADELPIKLTIFDKKTCFFAFEDPIKEKTSLTMLVTEHKAMAKSFTLLFDSIWKDARDYFVVNDKKYYIDDFANTQGEDVDNKEEIM